MLKPKLESQQTLSRLSADPHLAYFWLLLHTFGYSATLAYFLATHAYFRGLWRLSRASQTGCQRVILILGLSAVTMTSLTLVGKVVQ